MTTEQNMLDALIQHQVYAHRASTKVVNELNAEFVTASNSFASRLRDLLDNLTDAEKEALTLGKYTTDTLKEVKAAFDDWYTVVYTQLPETFAVSAVALATYEAAYVSKLYGEAIEFSGEKIFNKVKKSPIVGGQLYDEVWKTLANSTREKALYAVREGIQNGLTTAQIVSEIRGTRTKVGDKYEYVGGIVNQSKSQIESAVRTIRSQVSQVAYDNVFGALGFEYVKFLATIDGRVSKGCAILDQTVWKVGDPNIVKTPRHFNCRSLLIGVDKDGRMDGKRPFVMDSRPVRNIPKDERQNAIGQVDANTSFSKFFKTADPEFQKEWLGDARYKLYKNGGFSIDRFVDPLGRQYSISELKKLDAETFRRLGL